ncbi:MAG: hypothetical protein FRX48_07326 [Lasallia pustulata]|uniref:Thioesterase-like superfamily-domain-containing protein n=1 Tax=Lasallia pustulata TaxID=136370 RepID=A0A5M8PK67_9LECA|nr:MAG: hypothetical protein FRX48_07326 [Lasallia pustulata]
MSQIDACTPFAKALDLKREHDGGYSTRFPSSFCFGPKAHGGLLVSLVNRAASMHFDLSPNKPDQPDVLDLKIHFIRPTGPEDITIYVQDVSISRQTSLIEIKVYQRGKLNLIGLAVMGNFPSSRGIFFDTRWSLSPAPAEASIPRLASDSDPLWISYLCPWHPEGFRRPQSYVKFFVPMELGDPSYRDTWLTPSDPSFAFKTEHLGFVGDMTLPILDNFCGESGTGSHATCIKLGLEQKRHREHGIERAADAESGAFTAPMIWVTLSFNMEVKKRLPPEGTRWLFSRCRARLIKDGRMDNEILILDEHGQLVAIVQQVVQVIDLTDSQDIKAKL